jgi:glycosyltransferase involved in cell wall biosynthesis
MNLKISIITPALNCISHIENAIRNVLDQGYENFEHVVIDGGSTDGTCDVLKKYSHLVWISEPDHGQTHAMNKGLRIATGDVITFLNGDDYFLPGAFQAIIPVFMNGAKIVVGKIKVEKEIGELFINDPKVRHEEMLKHWEMNAYPYNPVGYFCSKEVFEKVGGFNEQNYMQDLEFLLTASKFFPFTKIDAILGTYRDYEDTITQRSQKKRSYWTKKNFRFIDSFLNDLPAGERRKFEKDRKKGYRQQRKFQRMKRYFLLVQNKPEYSKGLPSALFYRLKLMYYLPDKVKFFSGIRS